MKKFVFFSINDFQKEGGGTIRMLGILNELAQKPEVEITLISNIRDSSKLDAKIKTININYIFSPKDKRRFQFLLGAFSYKKLNNRYKKLLNVLKNIYQNLDTESNFFFFEYLDNSIGYWLCKNNVIKNYYNDIHGIASNEFDFQYNKSTSVVSRFKFSLKKKISLALDKKVFEGTNGILYASEAMKNYYYNLYPSLKNKKNIYLPYFLNSNNVTPIDEDFIEKTKAKYHFNNSDFIYLFTGAFKETGGVQDNYAETLKK